MDPFIRHIIVDLLGLNARYLIHKLIGRPKTRKFLKGDPKNPLSIADQDFANGLTGFAVLAIVLSCLYFFSSK